ncbi:MAG TPA: helix-turn-helix domain-containing protein [Ktedonobacterales bacterium]|nr:helix-turn-helix domain-containing protein [Ktedonobacterales bacterium]
MHEGREQVIETVIQQCADLLKTRVWAIDHQGAIIAGSEAAVRGLPLSDVADTSETRLRVPMNVDGQQSITIVAETASDDATPFHLAQALVELIVNQVTVINQIPNRRQLERRFVYSLLFEPVSDEASALRHGASIGVDLTIPRAVLLIDASRYILGADRTTDRIADEGMAQKRAEGVIALIVEYFHLPRATICTYIGNGEVVVLKASTTKDLSAWTSREEGEALPIASWANLAALKRAARGLLSQLRAGIGSPVTIGIGRYYPGIDGLPRSYQDARAALTLGGHSLGPNRVHCLDALGIAAFVGVADARTKIDLATHLLSPLDHEDELLQTLQAFFEQDCCISATANSLGIHRNTLNYRLEKVASLTGLDPHRFDDAVQIRLSLVLRSLESEPADYADAQYLAVKHA